MAYRIIQTVLKGSDYYHFGWDQLFWNQKKDFWAKSTICSNLAICSMDFEFQSFQSQVGKVQDFASSFKGSSLLSAEFAGRGHELNGQRCPCLRHGYGPGKKIIKFKYQETVTGYQWLKK